MKGGWERGQEGNRVVPDKAASIRAVLVWKMTARISAAREGGPVSVNHSGLIMFNEFFAANTLEKLMSSI